MRKILPFSVSVTRPRLFLPYQTGFTLATTPPTRLMTYRVLTHYLGETLYLLSTHPDARQYHPVLAMEARERGARTKAELLMNEYGGSFGSLSYTLHPSGIEGEAAGKSSNLSWAIRQAWYSLSERDPRTEAKTVVTVIDSDSECGGDVCVDESVVLSRQKLRIVSKKRACRVRMRVVVGSRGSREQVVVVVRSNWAVLRSCGFL